MKLPVLCSFALLAVSAASHAGSFGGPPPFTDLSPLQSGIDGSYQATCRGENLTGVIRFAYQNGVQSSIPTANTYNMFVNGQTVTGFVTASITGKDLAGVLGGQDFTVPTSSTGSTQIPLIFIVRGNRANGQFEGRLDLEDRMSAFSGDGNVAPAPAERNTVILVSTNRFGTGTIQISPFLVGASTITPTDFTFEGVRTSVFAQGSAGSTASTSSTTGN